MGHFLQFKAPVSITLLNASLRYLATQTVKEREGEKREIKINNKKKNRT